MSDAVSARAPGKLFLTGEYAVLRGAPAVVAAVDRFATVELHPAADRGPLVIHSLAEGRSLRVSGSEASEWGDIGAVLAALRAIGARNVPLADRGAEVVVDSRPFLSGSQKLGLGRSAATITAAVSAFLASAGRTEPRDLLEAAVAAHAQFQGERGSGADVAAACHGGVLEVTRRDGALAVSRRELPGGLCLLVGFTGEAAPTGPLLERFAAAAARASGTLAELARVAAAAAGAVARGESERLIEAVASSAALLERLGRETGLPIVTPALARLVAAAERVGAAAKPSGAGGGDCGIALARSSREAEAVRVAWREAGIVPLAVTIAAGGVLSESAAELAREVSLG